MSRTVDVSETAGLLSSEDNILILTHKNPDGDTLGSGFALWLALDSLGKKARVANENEFPQKYAYMYYPNSIFGNDGFKPKYIVAVDVAESNMLGGLKRSYSHVNLSIDHHGTHVPFEDNLLCRADSGSCCEIIADIVDALGVNIDKSIADALFTGVCSDTGCFRFSNTTPSTLILGARLMECGADTKAINSLLFESKSRVKFELELAAMQSLRFFCNDAVAAITITRKMMEGCLPSDVEGIASIPTTIEGVEVGILLRELAGGGYKVSVRTSEKVNAAAICGKFGGGGHLRAAGCELPGNGNEAVATLLAEIEKVLP